MAYIQNPDQNNIIFKGDKPENTPLTWAEMDTNLYILSSSIGGGDDPGKIAEVPFIVTTDQVVQSITYNSAGTSPQPSAVTVKITATGFETPQFRITGTLFGSAVNQAYSSGTSEGDSFKKTFTVNCPANVSSVLFPGTVNDDSSQLTVTVREGTDDTKTKSNTYTIFGTRPADTIQTVEGGIVIDLLKRTTIIPVNIFGVPKDLSQTTNQLGVFEGVQTLEYVSNLGSVTPGKWTIASIQAVNITAGVLGQAGNFATFGQLGFPEDINLELTANITYNVTGSSLEGTAFQRSAVQTITFAIDGIEGQVGPGVVYRGEFSPTKIYYYTDIRRDVVKKIGENEFYVVNNPEKNEQLGSEWGAPTGSNNNWAFLGTQVDFVATDILLAQDAYIDKTLNIGSTAAGAARIALVGGAVHPYISVGQTDTVTSQGFTQPGIFLGYSGSASTGRLSIISGSSSSQKGLIWDGENLIIKGAIRQNDSGDPLTEFNFRGPWTLDRNYEEADVVVYTDVNLSGSLWFCQQDHLSSTTNEPIEGAEYQDFWVPFTLPGTQGVGYSVFLSRRLSILGKDEEDNLVFTNSGTDIIALKNGEIMTPVTGSAPNTLGANQFTVLTGSLQGIAPNQVGPISPQGTFMSIGDHTGIQPDTETANIEYRIFFGGVIEPARETQILTIPLRGADGEVGPGVVFRGAYNTNDYYFYTSERRDIVQYSANGSNYWLVNVKSTDPQGILGQALGNPGSGNSNWKAFGAEFSSVATDILLAKDATITRGLVMGTSGSFSGFIRSVNANSLTNGRGFYMDVSGSARFGDPTTQQIFWNNDTSRLEITGSVQVGKIGLNAANSVISTGLSENALQTIVDEPNALPEGGLFITPTRVWQAKRNTTGGNTQLGVGYLNINLASTGSSKFEAVSDINGSGAIRILDNNNITLASRGFANDAGGFIVINTNSTQAVTDPNAGTNSKGILRVRAVPLIGSGSTEYYLPYAASGSNNGLAPVGSVLTITNSQSGNNLTEFVPNVTLTSGTNTISFDRNRIYGSRTAPLTGNLGYNTIGQREGIVQKLYHTGSSASIFPAGWTKIGAGTYSTTSLNIIFAEYVGNNTVEYWIAN